MPAEDVCRRLSKILPALFRKAFNKDLSESLAARNQELWFLGIDSKNKLYIDICGTIGPTILAAIQAKGFIDSDAGYKAGAQDVLPLDGRRADIFLLNKVHFELPAARLEPLVVHELAHLLEQIGDKPTPQGNDEENAGLVLKALKRNILHLHPQDWALHLAAAGRTLLAKNLTTHKTIREFLEAAIPAYDREGPIYAKKGP